MREHPDRADAGQASADHGTSAVRLAEYVRTVEDFPVPGVRFRDITPLLADAAALALAGRSLADPFRPRGIARVAGIEARGFVFGALVARELDSGFVPMRKPGKLPAASESVSYALEYGTASLHVHRDAIAGVGPVLIVDDVLATGGTAAAAAELVQRLGGELAGFAFLLEIDGLDGRSRLPAGMPVHSVMRI